MGFLFIVLASILLVISGLLFFNKGESAKEIKTLLTEILSNLKILFNNLNKLLKLVKGLVEEKLNNELDESIKKEQRESKSELESEEKRDAKTILNTVESPSTQEITEIE